MSAHEELLRRSQDRFLMSHRQADEGRGRQDDENASIEAQGFSHRCSGTVPRSARKIEGPSFQMNAGISLNERWARIFRSIPAFLEIAGLVFEF